MLVTSRKGRRCPVCGALHSACGGPSSVVAVDTRGAVMSGPLKRYEVTIGKNKTVLKLTEEAAATYEDATLVSDGDDAGEGEAPAKARPVASNKARKSSDSK